MINSHHALAGNIVAIVKAFFDIFLKGIDMIIYEPLWETMKKRNVTKYKLIRYYNIAKNTLDRMAKNLPTRSTTINDLCIILECEVGDIMKYIPD